MDRREDRLAFTVERLGADRTLLADASAEAKVQALTAGDGFDVVIDANRQRRRRCSAGSGSSGMADVTCLVRRRFATTSRFQDPEFHKRETTLFASRNAQSRRLRRGRATDGGR